MKTHSMFLVAAAIVCVLGMPSPSKALEWSDWLAESEVDLAAPVVSVEIDYFSASTTAAGTEVTLHMEPSPLPPSSSVLLNFPTSRQADFLIDGVHNWSDSRSFMYVLTQVGVGWGSQDPWWGLLTDSFSLAPGDHWVIAYLAPMPYMAGVDQPDWYGYSEPYTFTVVPEPATMSLLSLGGLALLRRRR